MKPLLDFAIGSLVFSFVGIIMLCGSKFIAWLFSVSFEVGFIIFVGILVYIIFSWRLGNLIRRER
jgi:hypothetical protein